MKELEMSAKTVEEAIRLALEQLGVTRNDVDVTVISKGKSGVLGIGAEDARVRVAVFEEEIEPEPDDAEVSRRVLFEMLHRMGISATIDVSRSSDQAAPVTLNIEGDDLGILIGRRGQALSSLQYLVRLIVAERQKKWISVNVDVDWYKKRHYESIRKLALRMADQVGKRRRPMTLEPMAPDERRIVHITLANHPDVKTESTGEGEERRVVIQSRKR